jgi:putative addiction module killer protein
LSRAWWVRSREQRKKQRESPAPDKDTAAKEASVQVKTQGNPQGLAGLPAKAPEKTSISSNDLDNPYPIGYNYFDMYTLIQSSVFAQWLRKMNDEVGKAAILRRISNAELGNFGDCETVGDGVSEMRVHVGPGYRVYFMRQGLTVYFLLCGGNKASQKRDIQTAKTIAKLWKEQSR